VQVVAEIDEPDRRFVERFIEGDVIRGGGSSRLDFDG